MNLRYPFPSYLISTIHKISDLLVSYIFAILNNLVCFQTDEGYISFIRDLVPDLCSESESAIINLLKSFYLTLLLSETVLLLFSALQTRVPVIGFLHNLDIIFCRNLRCIKGPLVP